MKSRTTDNENDYLFSDRSSIRNAIANHFSETCDYKIGLKILELINYNCIILSLFSKQLKRTMTHTGFRNKQNRLL